MVARAWIAPQVVLGVLLLMLGVAGPASGGAECEPPAGDYVYRVYHEGDEVGRLAIHIAGEADRTVVRTEIVIEIKMLFFIPILDFRHESEEIWRDGRFERFAGRTVDNGREHVIVVEPEGENLRLLKQGDPPALEDASLLSWTVWCEAALAAGHILNPLKGRTKAFTASPPVEETISIEGARIEARRYDVVYRSPDGSDEREGAIWYGPDGVVAKFTFETKRATMATLVRALPTG